MFRQVTAEPILGRWSRLKGLANQFHIGFFGSFPTFATVAWRTGRYQIVPSMRATLAARNDVIYGQKAHLATAVLACVIVATEDLSLGQCDPGTRPFDHVVQLDYRGDFISSRATSYQSSAVQDDFSLT
jgi:hypothetical protein